MNLSAQWLLIFYVANQVLSCMVQALPEPISTSGMGYRFVYKFLSLLIADFKSFSNTLPKPTIVETPAAKPPQNVGIL